ncbi:MAG: sensor histidine kinase [Desulfobulbaceae bacterium]
MKYIHLPKFEKFLFRGRPDYDALEHHGPRYQLLRRNLLVTMFLLILTPLFLTSLLSIIGYRELLQKETLNYMHWQGENSRYTLIVLLEKLRKALVITANSYPVTDLSTKDSLDRIFASLKSEYNGLVDLSLIGPDGIQVSYAGPYDLAGKNYRDSPWYTSALARKVYTSDVFIGFRNIPHFVITVSKKEPSTSGYWVLRASIDTKTLEDFFGSLSMEPGDDIFLLNQEGILQTDSRFSGKAGEKYANTITAGTKDFEIITQQRNGIEILRAAGAVPDTPWTLVLEQKNFAERKAWYTFRNRLAYILLGTVILAGIITVNVASLLTSKIRDTEKEREKLFKTHEHTNKLASIGRLAAGVAHEINNPLAIIKEKAGLMKDLIKLTPDFPQQDKFLAQLISQESAVERARTITHRLLSFARRMDVSLKKLQLNEVIQEVLGFLEKEILYHNIQLTQELQEDLPMIIGDQGQLQQIFLNIINNAIDAIEKDGTISITTQQITASRVQVEIRDNGPGIPSHILKNIFEPFFTTKTGADKQGTGLGLSITYGLVKRLGGEIYVTSEDGEGTLFTLVFPIEGAASGA